MNDCLPQRESGSQRGTAGTSAEFARAFADAPDLSDMTFAARRVFVESAALFHEHGAAGTSVRDIAKACGLTPGAFYKHFASRDDLLHRLVCHGHDTLEARIADTLAGCDAAPVATLRGFVHAYVMGHLVHPELARVVRREYVHLSEPRLSETVRRRRNLRTRLEKLLADGVRAGTMHLPDGPQAPRRTAVMVLDMCSRTSDWYDPARAGSESPERLADRYVVAALRLVGADDS